MKKCLAIIFLLSLPARAVDLSLVVDANMESSRVSNLVGTVDSPGKTGFGIGGLLSFEMGRMLSLETGALMVNRKYSIGTQTMSFTRLQIPITFKVTALKIINFGAGPYAEFSMGDVATENSTTQTKANASYESLNFDSTDFGVLATVGVDLPVAPLFSVVADLRYCLGLKDYDNSVAVSRKFGGLMLIAGVKLSL